MKVDIITPSSTASRRELQEGMKLLKEWGLNPCFKGGFLKGSFFAQEEKKASQIFRQSLLDKKTKVLWSLRGGYGSQRLPHYLTRIQIHSLTKKIFIGYSDATILHDWIHQNLSWPSLHFPVLSKVSSLASSSKTKFKNLIQKKIDYIEFFNLKLLNPNRSFKNIISRMTGGNLTLIQTSIGTLCNSSRKNKILFLEDVNEKPYALHRALWQMKESGVFKGVRAVIFGEFDLEIRKKGFKTFLKSMFISGTLRIKVWAWFCK